MRSPLCPFPYGNAHLEQQTEVFSRKKCKVGMSTHARARTPTGSAGGTAPAPFGASGGPAGRGGGGAGPTWAGWMPNASPMRAYSSRALPKPSTRPVGLPCASCVWNCSRDAPADGAGAAAGATAAASLSTSLEVSLDLSFFLLLSPSGIFRAGPRLLRPPPPALDSAPGAAPPRPRGHRGRQVRPGPAPPRCGPERWGPGAPPPLPPPARAARGPAGARNAPASATAGSFTDFPLTSWEISASSEVLNTD